LFIVGGAFAGLEHIIEQRAGKKTLGFTAELPNKSDADLDTVYSEVRPEDLLKFGLIPEFVGRLPVIATVDKLSEADLKRILIEPRNALTKQYQKLFEIDAVALEFTGDAVEAIAEQAMLRGTGARGLRAILEEVLLNVMYDVPSRQDIAKVVISGEVVSDNVNPTLVPREEPAAAVKKRKSA